MTDNSRHSSKGAIKQYNQINMRAYSGGKFSDIVLSTNVAEKYLDSLQNTDFKVMKCFNLLLKKKRVRILRLTKKGIENIRSSGDVSSFYCYDSIESIFLRSPNVFVIVYLDGLHEYVYSSESAAEIVQEIRIRLKFTRAARHNRNIITHDQSTMSDISSDMESYEFENEFDSIDADPEVLMDSLVTRLLSDVNTTEGTYLKTFLNKAFNSSQYLKTLKNVISNLQYYVMETQAGEIESIFANRKQDSYEIIRMSLEKAIIPRVKYRVEKTMETVYSPYDMKIQRDSVELLKKDQNFFLIPEQFQSCSKWKIAVLELKQMQDINSIIPFELVETLVRCAKSIYIVNAMEHGEDQVIAMDDFLPILIYIIVRSRVTNLYSIVHYCIEVADSDSMAGEKGFYLTAFSSALTHIHKNNFTI